jgi:hypothetical protein
MDQATVSTASRSGHRKYYISSSSWKVWSRKETLSFIKLHAMKVYTARKIKAPCIPSLGTKWKWVVSFNQAPLSPWGKSEFHQIGSWVGSRATATFWQREKKSQFLLERERRLLRLSPVVYWNTFVLLDILHELHVCKTVDTRFLSLQI